MYVHTHIHMYKHTHVHTYSYVHIHRYLWTYIPKAIHTFQIIRFKNGSLSPWSKISSETIRQEKNILFVQPVHARKPRIFNCINK